MEERDRWGGGRGAGPGPWAKGEILIGKRKKVVASWASHHTLKRENRLRLTPSVRPCCISRTPRAYQNRAPHSMKGSFFTIPLLQNNRASAFEWRLPPFLRKELCFHILDPASLA